MASLSKPDDLSLATSRQVFVLSGRRDLAAKFRALHSLFGYGERASSSRRWSSGEIGPDLFRAACRMGLRDWYPNIGTAPIKAAGRGIV